MLTLFFIYLFSITVVWGAVLFHPDVRKSYKDGLYTNSRMSHLATIFFISFWSPWLVADYAISFVKDTLSWARLL